MKKMKIYYYSCAAFVFIVLLMGYASHYTHVVMSDLDGYSGGDVREIFILFVLAAVSVFLCITMIFIRSRESRIFGIIGGLFSLHLSMVMGHIYFNRGAFNEYLDLQQCAYIKNVKDMSRYLLIHKKYPPDLMDIFIDERDKTDPPAFRLSQQAVAFRLAVGGSATNIVREFDGTGGWVYDPEKGIFGINVKGMEPYSTNLNSYLESVKNEK